jgi:putative nucleotidyltransferase with HDIG domain
VSPRRRSELYRLAVGLAAAAIFVATLGALLSARPDWWLAASLGVAGLLALRFPLHVSLTEKFSVGSAVFFAAAILMPAWQAAALVAATMAADTGISAVRRVAQTREKPPLGVIALSLVFNSGQLYLSVLAASLVLSAAGVSVARGLGSAEQGVAVVAAAVVMYATNVFLVATAAALATGRNPVKGFLNTQKVVSAQFAGLYLLGAAAAFVSVRMPWVPALSIVPGVIAYRSLRHRIELRQEALRAIERIAAEVDRRDPYTYQHSQRVAIYTHAIGRQLGFSKPEIELVELAAKVHDIGKIRIPDSILLKPGKLSAEERRVMETHPRLGVEILSQFSDYAKVLDLVLTHHERYDGAGYPNGVVGKGLLLIAQVIPVADSLDAMTTARAYRGARSWETAMHELQRGAGTQWNPRVVDAAIVALFGEETQPARPRVATVATA